MKIGGMLSSKLVGKGFIIPFSVLAKCSHTLIGKNVTDAKGKVIGTVTSVEIDKPNKEVYFFAEVTKKLPEGGSLVQIKGRIDNFTLKKLKLVNVKE